MENTKIFLDSDLNEQECISKNNFEKTIQECFNLSSSELIASTYDDNVQSFLNIMSDISGNKFESLPEIIDFVGDCINREKRFERKCLNLEQINSQLEVKFNNSIEKNKKIKNNFKNEENKFLELKSEFSSLEIQKIYLEEQNQSKSNQITLLNQKNIKLMKEIENKTELIKNYEEELYQKNNLIKKLELNYTENKVKYDNNQILFSKIISKLRNKNKKFKSKIINLQENILNNESIISNQMTKINELSLIYEENKRKDNQIPICDCIENSNYENIFNTEIIEITKQNQLLNEEITQISNQNIKLIKIIQHYSLIFEEFEKQFELLTKNNIILINENESLKINLSNLTIFHQNELKNIIYYLRDIFNLDIPKNEIYNKDIVINLINHLNKNNIPDKPCLNCKNFEEINSNLFNFINKFLKSTESSTGNIFNYFNDWKDFLKDQNINFIDNNFDIQKIKSIEQLNLIIQFLIKINIYLHEYLFQDKNSYLNTPNGIIIHSDLQEELLKGFSLIGIDTSKGIYDSIFLFLEYSKKFNLEKEQINQEVEDIQNEINKLNNSNLKEIQDFKEFQINYIDDLKNIINNKFIIFQESIIFNLNNIDESLIQIFLLIEKYFNNFYNKFKVFLNKNQTKLNEIQDRKSVV